MRLRQQKHGCLGALDPRHLSASVYWLFAMRFADCRRGTFILSDDALGTEFLRLGAKFGDCLDQWNLTKPDLVRQVAESYIHAGSRVILTNTFRANPITLASFGLQGQCVAINRAGVRISRQAAQNSALVFASMGPIGKGTTHGQLRNSFSVQAKALASEGPDALLIETMTDVEEARIAVGEALKTGLPVVVSLVLAWGKHNDTTLTGSTPEHVATALVSEGVHAIGANCIGIRESIPVCKRLAAVSSLPLWIKPNAGLPEFSNGVPTYKITPEEFADSALELPTAGATFLGGCCGTSPAFIRALAARFRP